MNIVSIETNGIENLKEELKIKKRSVIIDADFIPFIVCYKKKQDDLEVEEYTENDLPLIYDNIKELVISLLNNIQEYFEIEDVFFCIKGNFNFRKVLYPKYKKNRTSRNELHKKVFEFLEKNYGAFSVVGGAEADDMVYSLSKNMNHKAIIISNDKDLLQIPSIIYNPKKNKWIKITEKEAKFNLAIQCLIGDSSDNINFFKGVGIKTAISLLNKDMNDFQYMKTIMKFLEKKKFTDYKNKLKMSYNLVRLYDLL